MDALQLAIDLCGGSQVVLAARLTEVADNSERISEQMISNWKKRGVPVKKAVLFERAFPGRITRADFHPEVFGPAMVA